MLTKLKSLFTSNETRREASYFSKVEMPYFGLNNTENYLKNLVRRLPLAGSCISLRARKVRFNPWKIVDENGKEVKKHNIYPLIKPNSFQTFGELLELMVWHLDALGNSYAVKIKRNNLPYSAIYLLRPQQVTPFTIDDLFVTKYEYQTGDKLLEFEPNEIIHLKYPNPQTPCYGLGLIQMAELLLQRNLNRDSYMESYYKNGTVLSGIFTTDSTAVSKDQIDRMRLSFEKAVSGVSNFFKSFFVWAGFKFQPVTTNNRDSQDAEQTVLTRDDILAAFGVPGALLGYTDGVNFSNAEIQERVFINNTLIPLLGRLEEIITEEIVKPFNSLYRFEFIKPINENLNEKSVWVSKAFTDNVISKEQYAKLMGVESDGKDAKDGKGEDKPSA